MRPPPTPLLTPAPMLLPMHQLHASTATHAASTHIFNTPQLILDICVGMGRGMAGNMGSDEGMD